MKNVSTIKKLASTMQAETLKAIAANAMFEACTQADKIHYQALAELKAAVDNELSKLFAACDYAGPERDTQSGLYYLASIDTQANTSKQLAKVYIKRDFSAHIVINASLKAKALADERLAPMFDEAHKKCIRFVAPDMQAIVKILKAIIAISK